MSENQEQAPVEQTQQPVAAGVDFAAQVELLKAKNQELIAEKQKVKANFEDLQKQLDTLQAGAGASQSKANFKNRVSTKICGKKRTTLTLS